MTFKKLATLAMATVVSASLLVGCSSSNESATDDKITVAIITDVAGVNDQSFNQSAWEGLQKAEKELGVKVKYLESQQDSDYATNIDTLADEEVDLIVGVGMKLAGAIEEGAKLYPDQKFAIVDETYEQIPQNVKTILFQAEQSAYLAGLVSGRMTKTNNIGFIGGMEIPSVQRFNWGFQQGINYANSNYGTALSMKPENFIYQGTFTDIAAGQQLSAQLYDKGVDVIFSAAGAVGTGVIKEARERAGKGENVWVIGVDVDQYDDGIYEGNKSVVLTSAIKKIDEAAYQIIEDEINGEFPGGQVLRFDAKNDAVGIPSENPNLSEDTITKVNEVINAIKADEVEVKTEL